METLTAENASQELLKLIASAQEESCQFRITSENGNAILLSEEFYQNLLVTLEFLATPSLTDNLKPFPSLLEE